MQLIVLFHWHHQVYVLQQFDPGMEYKPTRGKSSKDSWLIHCSARTDGPYSYIWIGKWMVTSGFYCRFLWHLPKCFVCFPMILWTLPWFLPLIVILFCLLEIILKIVYRGCFLARYYFTVYVWVKSLFVLSKFATCFFLPDLFCTPNQSLPCRSVLHSTKAQTTHSWASAIIRKVYSKCRRTCAISNWDVVLSVPHIGVRDYVGSTAVSSAR